MRGHVEIVRLLCERSADRSIRNKQDKVRDIAPINTCNAGGCVLLVHLNVASHVIGIMCIYTGMATGCLNEIVIGTSGSGSALLVALLPLHQGGAGQLSGTVFINGPSLLHLPRMVRVMTSIKLRTVGQSL
jgi:hypothetical protein